MPRLLPFVAAAAAAVLALSGAVRGQDTAPHYDKAEIADEPGCVRYTSADEPGLDLVVCKHVDAEPVIIDNMLHRWTNGTVENRGSATLCGVGFASDDAELWTDAEVIEPEDTPLADGGETALLPQKSGPFAFLLPDEVDETDPTDRPAELHLDFHVCSAEELKDLETMLADDDDDDDLADDDREGDDDDDDLPLKTVRFGDDDDDEEADDDVEKNAGEEDDDDIELPDGILNDDADDDMEIIESTTGVDDDTDDWYNKNVPATAAPTEEATERPTPQPTAAPSPAPSKAPSKPPTKAPTRKPTARPTAAPSPAPTVAKTPAPTEKATEAATEPATTTTAAAGPASGSDATANAGTAEGQQAGGGLPSLPGAGQIVDALSGGSSDTTKEEETATATATGADATGATTSAVDDKAAPAPAPVTTIIGGGEGAAATEGSLEEGGEAEIPESVPQDAAPVVHSPAGRLSLSALVAVAMPFVLALVF